jgi:hypothetical protein
VKSHFISFHLDTNLATQIWPKLLVLDFADGMLWT